MRLTETNFTDILKQHERILFKVSNAYCEDPEDRKDIVQEIVLQLWNAKNRYNPAYKLSTWIYRIALNVAISHYRKTMKKKDAQLDLQSNLITISEDQHRDNNLDENLKTLHQFINELDKLNKALILLYLEEYSYSEISEVLGISETNVATKINRIKKKLKKRFEDRVNQKV